MRYGSQNISMNAMPTLEDVNLDDFGKRLDRILDSYGATGYRQRRRGFTKLPRSLEGHKPDAAQVRLERWLNDKKVRDAERC
jgi:hypothetical protein